MRKLLLMISLVVCTISAQAADYNWALSDDGVSYSAFGLDRGSLAVIKRGEEDGELHLGFFTSGSYGTEGTVRYAKTIEISALGASIGGWKDTKLQVAAGGALVFQGFMPKRLARQLTKGEVIKIQVTLYGAPTIELAFLSEGVEVPLRKFGVIP